MKMCIRDRGKTILNVENRDGQIKSYKASKDYGTFKITEALPSFTSNTYGSVISNVP